MVANHSWAEFEFLAICCPFAGVSTIALPVPPSVPLQPPELLMSARWIVAVVAVFAFTAAGFAQAPKPADPKKDDKPAEKKEEPKKERGQLPQNWKSLGLTDKQVQEIYKIQNKYGDEIDTLEAKIKDLKEKMSKERGEVLTSEQKKRLEEILKEKSGTGDKPKDK